LAIRVCVLASGSGGNCTYMGDGHNGLLVDAGISGRQIADRLAACGLADAPIDAVLLTHEHRDHVQGARVLAERLARRGGRAPAFWATPGTAGAIPTEHRPAGLTSLPRDRRIAFGALQVQPFAIPHDTAEPVGYRIDAGSLSLGIVTDLGRSTSLVEAHLADLDLAIVEFNHDEEMLMEGRYPWWLKQRVRSNHGHLSNDQAAALVERVVGARLRHLVLGHISQENNRPARALAAAHAALSRCPTARDVRVTAASQDEPSPLLTLESTCTSSPS